MKADEFIDFASGCVFKGVAGRRSAASRAYYGAFHLATDLLKRFDLAPNQHAAHIDVRRSIGSSSHIAAQEASRLLDDLHGLRIKADYRLGHTDIETQACAMECVEMASSVKRLLEEFRTACQNDEDVLTDLKAGIAKYRKLIGN